MTDTPLSAAASRELRLWTAIGVAALAVSGVLAPMLAISRAPGMDAYLPWAEQAFVRAIIEHVVFSVVVWTLAIFGGLLTLAAHLGSTRRGTTRQGEAHRGATPKAKGLGMAGVWLMAPVFVLLFVPALLARAEPSLNNYVPVMIDPLYYAGVVLLFTAIALPTLRLLINRPVFAQLPSDADEGLSLDGMGAAALTYMVALVCFLTAWTALGNEPPSKDYNEDLFWGGGHVLQILNAILMMTVWVILGRQALAPPLLNRRVFRIVLWLSMLAALTAAMLYAAYRIDSPDLQYAHSKLKYVLVVPLVLFGLAALPTLMTATKAHWRDPAFVALALSIGLFGAGGVMGFFADGTDTRTPGHYHAVLGGVNLAFFGLVLFYFLPKLGRPLKETRWRFAPLYIYAVGQFLQSAGMFIAEAPRKTMGQAQMLETATEKFGMHLNQNGALIAVIGGILFVWIAGRALLRRN